MWLELLFAVGYRPELKGRLDKMVAEDVRKFRMSKENANGMAVTRSQTRVNGAGEKKKG